MKQEIIDLSIGGLLHDIGKLLYRYNDGRNHSTSGHDYIKEKTQLNNASVLEQIKYHHGKLLGKAKLEKNSLAYITYIADNIASMADRRKKDEEGKGFVRELPLESIFNILNGNSEEKQYPLKTLENQEVVYPIAKESNKMTAESFYGSCLHDICDSIKGVYYEASYVNSLLEIIEATMTFIPSSTSIAERADVSLYDHSKLTAALGCCIYQYLESQDRTDYQFELLKNSKAFYEEKAFILYSLDISGIQDFIYTISSEKALKNLRSRSFYLEVMMEHIVDEILMVVGVPRTNLIYCGGGHAYLLFANTESVTKSVEEEVKRINKWFLNNFGTKLFLANGYSECTANSLKNEPAGSYANIFKEISNHLSRKKMSRYTGSEINQLNQQTHQDTKRECKTCKTSNNLLDTEKCVICTELEWFSKQIQKKEFFTVVDEKQGDAGLPLPNDKYLLADTMDTLITKMKESRYIRSYCKNQFFTGASIASKIWVGDYEEGGTFEDLAEKSEGIKRLGVLRADVDNLGQAFVNGFSDQYVSLSRTATFSRKLSHFFKRNINDILEKGEYSLDDEREQGERRNATIIYSGGDDLFIVGAWDDVIGLAVDIKGALERYSQGMLTLSGGIGLYNSKYPISSMAREVGTLEAFAKEMPKKDALTLFSKEHCYQWEYLIEDVIEGKYRLIAKFFKESNERGKGFLYKLLDYMREYSKEDGEKINLARYAYLLARMEPDKDANSEQQNLYKEFSKSMYQWIRNSDECREAITAIYLYVYMNREAGNYEDKQIELCR